MADISITVGNVARSGNDVTLIKDYPAGETITAGMAVYLKSSDSKWYKAQCDGTAEESGSGVPLGVALHGSLANQPLVVQTQGLITIGGTVAAGTEYVVSATAGGIAPHTDLVSTNKYSRIGYATTSALLMLAPLGTGVAVA